MDGVHAHVATTDTVGRADGADVPVELVETGSLDGRQRWGAVLVAESGCDIDPDEARGLGVELVPTHVLFGSTSFDDGTFAPGAIEQWHRDTGLYPTTAAPNPARYRAVFERLRDEHPDRYILHLGYTARASSSFANAVAGSQGIPGVIHVDSRTASVGQGSVVRAMAAFVRERPCADRDAVIGRTLSLVRRSRFGFIPARLDYLKAGGRLSNAAYVGASLLKVRPVIELMGGRVVCTKKSRGSMVRVCAQALEEFVCQPGFDLESLYLAFSDGIDPTLRASIDELVRCRGWGEPVWYPVGGVITVHGGPGAFGFGGFMRA